MARKRVVARTRNYPSDTQILVREAAPMARWPRHVWTSIFTYAVIFILFPLICLLAYAWVRGAI